MTVWDIVKALLIALLLMVLNVAIAFGVVAVYAYFVEPGHDQAFYQSAAERIAPWSSVFGGSVLFFAAAYVFGKRGPQRNAYLFGAAILAIYAAIDAAMVVSMGSFGALLGVWTISQAAKLAGALAGAHLARR